jgi:uncharacterized membrane protein YqjE
MGAENGNARMAAEVRRLADALSRLVREHFDLARAEIRRDVSNWGQDALVALAAVPFAVIGLLLVDLALSALLARAIGVPGALAVLGAVNLGVAGALGLLAERRFRARRAALRGTAEELRRDREALRHARQGLPANGQARPVSPAPPPPLPPVRAAPPGAERPGARQLH